MAEIAAAPVAANPRTGAAAPYRLVLLVLIAAFILIKLIYILKAGPIADEAYYWVWGRHPQLSYYDHPPLQAWLLGLSDLAFGRSLLSLRWLTLACLGATFYVYHLWAKRLAGENWQDLFWPGILIYLASPTFGFFSSLAMHDYLLVLLALLSAHFFLNFFTAVRTDGRGRLADLYLGALFLGLMGLTKYSAVLFGLGVCGYILASRPLRPLLRNPHLYFAALLAFALQLPYLVWNLQHGFASFRFHLEDRHPGNWLDTIKPASLGEFVAVSVLLVGPFLVPVFYRFLTAKPATEFERTAQGLGRWLFWVSTLLFLGISLFDEVWWWWNLLAYIVVLPFAAKYMGRVLLFGHVAFGLVVQLFLLISSTVVPVTMLFGGADPIRSQLFGWEQLQEPIARLAAQYRPGFIAGARYELASVVAFATDDPSVTTLGGINEFAFLFDHAAHRGESALVVLRDDNAKGVMEAAFEQVTPLEIIPIERFGVNLGSYEIYLGNGFRPRP